MKEEILASIGLITVFFGIACEVNGWIEKPVGFFVLGIIYTSSFALALHYTLKD